MQENDESDLGRYNSTMAATDLAVSGYPPGQNNRMVLAKKTATIFSFEPVSYDRLTLAFSISYPWVSGCKIK
jgi:hypothetical protein